MSHLLGFGTLQTTAAATFAGGAYTTVLTSMPSRIRQIYITNSLDASMTISFDSGATSHIVLLSGQSFTLNLAEDDALIYTGSAIKMKSTTTDPTTGSIFVGHLKTV